MYMYVQCIFYIQNLVVLEAGVRGGGGEEGEEGGVGEAGPTTNLRAVRISDIHVQPRTIMYVSSL